MSISTMNNDTIGIGGKRRHWMRNKTCNEHYIWYLSQPELKFRKYEDDDVIKETMNQTPVNPKWLTSYCASVASLFTKQHKRRKRSRCTSDTLIELINKRIKPNSPTATTLSTNAIQEASTTRSGKAYGIDLKRRIMSAPNAYQHHTKRRKITSHVLSPIGTFHPPSPTQTSKRTDIAVSGMDNVNLEATGYTDDYFGNVDDHSIPFPNIDGNASKPAFKPSPPEEDSNDPPTNPAPTRKLSTDLNPKKKKRKLFDQPPTPDRPSYPTFEVPSPRVTSKLNDADVQAVGQVELTFDLPQTPDQRGEYVGITTQQLGVPITFASPQANLVEEVVDINDFTNDDIDTNEGTNLLEVSPYTPFAGIKSCGGTNDATKLDNDNYYISPTDSEAVGTSTASAMPVSLFGEEEEEEYNYDEEVVTPCGTTASSIESNTTATAIPTPTSSTTPAPTPSDSVEEAEEEEENDAEEQANAQAVTQPRRSARLAAAANAQNIAHPRRSTRLAAQPRVDYTRFYRLRG